MVIKLGQAPYISKKSNFHRFRNERHRVYDYNYQINSNIHFHNIVAMNRIITAIKNSNIFLLFFVKKFSFKITKNLFFISKKNF